MRNCSLSFPGATIRAASLARAGSIGATYSCRQVGAGGGRGGGEGVMGSIGRVLETHAAHSAPRRERAHLDVGYNHITPSRRAKLKCWREFSLKSPSSISWAVVSVSGVRTVVALWRGWREGAKGYSCVHSNLHMQVCILLCLSKSTLVQCGEVFRKLAVLASHSPKVAMFLSEARPLVIFLYIVQH